MKKLFLFSAVVSNLVFAGDNSSANYFINYQGYMLEANGSRANGIKPVTFSVYDSESNGSRVWTEKKDVKFINGIYSTKLGDTNDSIKSLNFKQSYWLTLKIGDENASELSPRQQFSAVPYALNAVQFYDELKTSIDGNQTEFNSMKSSFENNVTVLNNLKTNFDNNVDFVTLSLNNMTTFVDNLDDVVKELNASQMITSDWDTNNNGLIDANKTDVSVDTLLNRSNVSQTGTNAFAIGLYTKASSDFSTAIGF